MHDIPPAARELAAELLRQGSQEDPDSIELAMTAHHIFGRLEHRLSILFGRTGYSALLGRSLHLARLDSHMLDQLTVDRDMEGGIRGFRELGASHLDDPEGTEKALTSALANFIWLLVVFIGAELSVRLIVELWPDLAESAGGLSEQEGKPHS